MYETIDAMRASLWSVGGYKQREMGDSCVESKTRDGS
jgi:hypothetical protein